VAQVKEPKWSDRAGVLDSALEIMKKHPRIAGESRDFFDIVGALKLFLADSHQAVRGGGDVADGGWLGHDLSLGCIHTTSSLTTRAPPCMCGVGSGGWGGGGR
jgi:hypothetical protein